MLNVLTQILNGQVKPLEIIGEDSDEIKELEELITRNANKLNETLNKKQAEILERYMECIEEYYCLLVEDAFSVGFSLSTRILTESLEWVKCIRSSLKWRGFGSFARFAFERRQPVCSQIRTKYLETSSI